MKNIFEIAEACLHQPSLEATLAQTHQAWQYFLSGNLSFQSAKMPLAISETRFPSRPILLPPRQMPRRRFTTPEGIAAFFHALAHIEFVAIYLAWDIIYRFRGLPEQFYSDWLRVADEEAQHFSLIRAHLLTLGVEYGELPAHGGLWDHAQQTAEDLLARLAIVPRCMEARGLDVTPPMIEKFRAMGDEKGEIILTRILNDEVGHVQLGTKWFKYQCRQLSVDPDEKYKQLITQFFKGKPKGPFNRKMRIIGGFSDAELDWLENE
ncbi:MAG: ferritin-like domain-containing protein [Gammaproteobacteria bacterium]